MHRNTKPYTPEDVDCQFCTEYRKPEHGGKKRCTAKVCPWIAERIEGGVMDYETAVSQTFPKDGEQLQARLLTLIRRFPNSMFFFPGHKARMEAVHTQLGCRPKRDVPAYHAAVYLLTANQDLNRRAANCFCQHGIEFDYAMVQDISPHNYTLLSAARDIYTDVNRVMLSDLADGEIVDTLAFGLIVNALLIARYGPAVLDIRERSKG